MWKCSFMLPDNDDQTHGLFDNVEIVDKIKRLKNVSVMSSASYSVQAQATEYLRERTVETNKAAILACKEAERIESTLFRSGMKKHNMWKPTRPPKHIRAKDKMCTSQEEENKVVKAANAQEVRPFDFLQVLFEGAVAGGAAGVVVEAALYPIDTIKTRLQAVRGGGKIVLKGLYSGLAGNLAGVLPASAIFVGVYEPAKQKLLKSLPEHLSALAHLTSGALGGAASSIVRVPTEVVKQRMQTGQFATAPDAVRLIISKEGFRGLYAGYGSFLLRDLPFDAIQFCIYEQLRMGYKIAARRELNDPENAIIGAFAGAITGAITTPLDVIKTRLMVQGSANQYNGALDCARTILREEGPPALIKGIGPRVLWIGIGGSIFFGVLERTKQILAQRRPLAQNSDSIKSD